jgi:predicted nucleic acid-binding protein
MSRMRDERVRARLGPLIEQGIVGTCAVLDFEALWSIAPGSDVAEAMAGRAATYGWLPTDDRDLARATEVLTRLAELGRHRSVKWPDAIIAAIAERHRVTLLHYDADFDHVASITGQPMEWVVERGSIS